MVRKANATMIDFDFMTNLLTGLIGCTNDSPVASPENSYEYLIEAFGRRIISGFVAF